MVSYVSAYGAPVGAQGFERGPPTIEPPGSSVGVLEIVCEVTEHDEVRELIGSPNVGVLDVCEGTNRSSEGGRRDDGLELVSAGGQNDDGPSSCSERRAGRRGSSRLPGILSSGVVVTRAPGPQEVDGPGAGYGAGREKESPMSVVLTSAQVG